MSIIGGVIKQSVINGGLVINATNQRYFTTLSGSGAYYETDSGVAMTSGNIISFDFVAFSPQAASATLIDGDGGAVSIGVDATGANWSFVGLDNVELDGRPIVNGSAFPADGALHTIRMQVDAAGSIGVVGGNFTKTTFFAGIIANLNLNGVRWPIGMGPNEVAELPLVGANTLTAFGVTNTDKELFTLAAGGTQWDGDSGTIIPYPSLNSVAGLEDHLTLLDTSILNDNEVIL